MFQRKNKPRRASQNLCFNIPHENMLFWNSGISKLKSNIFAQFVFSYLLFHLPYSNRTIRSLMVSFSKPLQNFAICVPNEKNTQKFWILETDFSVCHFIKNRMFISMVHSVPIGSLTIRVASPKVFLGEIETQGLENTPNIP